MSDNKTSSFSVKLLKAHTHAGKTYAAGDVLAADKINQIVADWLVDNSIGEKVDVAATTKPATTSAPAVKAEKE